MSGPPRGTPARLAGRLGQGAASTGYGLAAGLALAWRVYHPPRESGTATPADHGLRYEDWTWQTHRDGLQASGWFVPGSGPTAVVLSHGMGRSRQAVLPHLRLLHDAGHSVLAYDLRNHGASGGTWRTWNMAERYTRDLQDAVAAVRADPRVPGRVGVLAFSFSTWPAVYATRRHRMAIDAVVCESGPVADIGGAFARLARLKALTLPRLGSGSAGERAFVATARAAGMAVLAVRGWPPRAAPGCPLLLIGGGRDRILPGAEVAALAEVLPGARSWTVPRALHVHGLRADPDGYRATVTDFLGEHLGARSGADREVRGA
ncbi:alpha/beta hydrolase [Modestobacter versicolor]|uniref:alpha/beta hydrolase n=1 Tax=Modestobacter versicolor TaxID=429133 RepID=UPI0034DF9725